MSNRPYMPLWVSDYIGDTQHLTAAEHGAYMLLIMAYWQRGGALPADAGRLSRIARMTADEWAQSEATLREFFTVEAGEWRHARIEAELAKVREKSAKAAASAKRRHSDGNADAQRTQSEGTCERNATHTHTQRSEESNLLPQEQEAAREEVKAKKFDLGGVGVGLGGDPSVEARRAVARELNIGDPTPILEAYRRWGPARRARAPDALFRKFASSRFPKLTGSELAACQPLAEPEPAIPKSTARPSPQLAALLANGARRHAH